jgi:thiamine pyrophosphokinase
MRAIVLADGAAPTRAGLDSAWPGWDGGIDLVVAADGGARLADSLGLPVHRWVGDGDSLGAAGVDALRGRGIPIALAARDKDETDTELALLAAVAAGASEIVVLGALGGPRVDHALANIALLGHPAASTVRLAILDDAARIRLLRGPSASLELPGRIGDLVSLIPLETATGVTTDGLRYPLAGATIAAGPARGISNIRVDAAASVRLESGRMLIVEAPATLNA